MVFWMCFVLERERERERERDDRRKRGRVRGYEEREGGRNGKKAPSIKLE